MNPSLPHDDANTIQYNTTLACGSFDSAPFFFFFFLLETATRVRKLELRQHQIPIPILYTGPDFGAVSTEHGAADVMLSVLLLVIDVATATSSHPGHGRITQTVNVNVVTVDGCVDLGQPRMIVIIVVVEASVTRVSVTTQK